MCKHTFTLKNKFIYTPQSIFIFNLGILVHSHSVMTKKLFTQLALILILLYAQYGSIVHASVHQFHEQEQYCEIFDANGNLEHGLLVTPASIALSFDPILCLTLPYHHGALYRPIPQSRSPPFIS